MQKAQQYGIYYYYGNKFKEQLARFHLGMDQDDSLNTFASFQERSKDWKMDADGVGEAALAIKKGNYVTKIKSEELTGKQRGEGDYDEIAKKHKEGPEKWKEKFNETVGKFWKVSFGAFTYGNARTFMLTDGVAHLFDKGRVIGPISWASHILDKMSINGFWESLPKVTAFREEVDKVGDLAYLIRKFITLKYSVPETFDWKRHIMDDMVMVNTFSTSLLEYFAYIVIPQWKLTEKALIAFTNGEVDEKTVNDSIMKLLELMDGKQVMDFLFKYIRFKNAQVRVIDYGLEGITEEQINQLNLWRTKRGIPLKDEKNKIIQDWESKFGKFGSMSAEELKGYIDLIENQITNAAYEAKYTGDHEFENDLRKYYQSMYQAYQSKVGPQEASKLPSVGVLSTEPMSGKSPMEEKEERARQAEERKKKEEEEEKKRAEEAQKRLAEEAKRREAVAKAEAEMKEMEAIKQQEQAYENMLEKLVRTPEAVTEKELKSFGDDVKNLKQEAENRIQQLPREERELKLALIRGDKVSDKTFKEMKDTAIGLHGSLQGYIDEVSKIPVGNVLAI